MSEDEKLRVQLLIPQLNTGGIQKMVVDLAENLLKLGMTVQIVCFGPKVGGLFEQKAEEKHIDVRYLGKRSGMDLTIIPKIYRAMKQFKPDVVHGHQRAFTYALLPTVLCGVKSRVYTIHNLAEKDTWGIQRPILRCAIRIFGVRLVAISDICKRSAVKLYHQTPDRVACIYNGIDTAAFRAPENTERKKENFVAVGRLSPQKNPQLMLRAFKTAHAQYPGAALCMLGDGKLRPELEQYIHDNGLTDSVRLEGDVSDVRPFLHQAGSYLMSSDYEGLPVAVLEAMAAGLPILSTKAGGVPDIVWDHKNGLLVDVGDEQGLADAMLTLLRDPEMQRNMAEESEKLALNYDIMNCARSYVEVYRQC